MNVWDWVNEFEAQARSRGDAQRVRLAQLHHEAYSYRHSSPERMLGLLEEGRHLAQALREPWWVLFYDHWILETHIYYRDDYRQVIDLAVRTTLELRKPIYEQHPLRFCIHCNLIAAYLCVDPRGYADVIQPALDYLQTVVNPEGEEKYLLLARQHWFAFEMGQMEKAREYCLAWLAHTDDDDDYHLALHHGVGAHLALCHVCHRLSAWQDLQGYAINGEELARRREAKYELAVFLIWQGLCLRKDGLSDESSRLVRLGTAQMSRLGKEPEDTYYEALTAYHEAADQLEQALAVRDRQLTAVSEKGQLATEADCRLHRLRLHRLLGRLEETEIAQTRTTIARLRKPESYLERLERVLQGGPAC